MKNEGFDSFDSLLKYLYQLQRIGIKTGLEHTEKLLEACGRPDNELIIIHIAGTNGKGSVSATLASILHAAGYKTGLYTSPHLLRFNERIRIDGTPISDNDIVRFIQEYRDDIDRIKATFFETTTALALWYFKKEKTDVCIVETGLGGRLDSTNVVQPKITVITPVDIDHAEYLGNTLEKIAYEKAGIIKYEIPLVLAPQKEAALNVILERAGRLQAQVFRVNENDIDDIRLGMDSTSFTVNNKHYKTPLLGGYQALNASLAIKTAILFDENIGDNILNKGLSLVSWPGRLQLLQSEPPVFYDVAHNPHGIEAVLKTIKELGMKKISGIMALKGDKNLDLIAESLRGKFHNLHSFNPDDNDLIGAKQLANGLKLRNVDCIDGSKDKRPFISFKKSLKEVDAGLIFGSHYIASTVFEEFDFSFDNGLI